MGWPQTNIRAASRRSDPSVGWYPIGIYDAATLACHRLVTSTWRPNCLAIHPSGDLVAIGTGEYDGGFAFEGELLIHDIAGGTTVSVLADPRCIEEIRWVDDATLELVVAPPTDEDADDLSELRYQRVRIEGDWAALAPAAVLLPSGTSTDRPLRDQDAARRTAAELAAARGVRWRPRRQAWAVQACDDGGLVLGLSAAVERWGARGSGLRWRTELDGTCTQLMSGPDDAVGVAVWADGHDYGDRATTLLTVDPDSGAPDVAAWAPGRLACAVTRADGHRLVRDTHHAGRRGRETASVLDPEGTEVGRVALGGYDLFNHYFGVRHSKDFLVLVGAAPRPWEDKWVAAVRGRCGGDWAVERLFPHAWTPGAHLFGGPGVFVDDGAGGGLVHAGTVHDGRGLLRGNAFVVRRSYPDGCVVWHHPLDNEVTGLDECGGTIVAVTNTGEMVVLDTLTGEPLARRHALLTPGGHRVVPLTLVTTSPRTVAVGTLDGRALEFMVPQAPGFA